MSNNMEPEYHENRSSGLAVFVGDDPRFEPGVREKRPRRGEQREWGMQHLDGRRRSSLDECKTSLAVLRRELSSLKMRYRRLKQKLDACHWRSMTLEQEIDRYIRHEMEQLRF